MQRAFRSWQNCFVVLGTLFVLSACSSSESRYPTGGTKPDSTHTDTTGGGNVQKATLNVAVLSSPNDAAVTSALGWSSASVAGAQVVIKRQGSTTNLTATTDSLGRARFTDLLPGSYDVSAIRILASAESQRLSGENADVNAFGGGSKITVSAPSSDANLTVVAGRRGSLVISELYRDSPFNAEGQYRFGRYLEIYNNADTAVALADKIYAKGFPGSAESPNFPCSLYQSIHEDPDGIWSPNVYHFPATAPVLQPGETAVIAMDAIDHTSFAAHTYDLSSASFEFPGTQDVDNPRVPNMVTLGPNSGDTFFGHGFEWYEVDEVAVLAQEVDLASLPTQSFPNSNTRRIVRIPADRILDVLVDRIVLSSPNPPCARAVNDRFDHQEISVVTDLDTLDVQRKVVGTLPSGRKLLLRTKTSARDFMAAPPTPGTIP